MQENPSENVFELISSCYYDLTAAEKKIADFITANPEIVQEAGITDLADACGTADATVSRFSRKLRYKGFNAMRIAIAQALSGKTDDADLLSGKIQMDDSFEDICRKIRAADIGVINQTVDLISTENYMKAIELLHKAGRVLCMGQGGSLLIAMEAAHLFSTVSGKFTAIADGHMQAIAASNLEPGDVIFYFSYSGSVRDMLETVPPARARGVKMILVTRFPNSPGAKISDVVLQCGSSESPFQLGSVPARISQLCMLDVLFSEYCRQDYETCRRSRERIASALSEKHL